MTEGWLLSLLNRYHRIAIAGSPRSGKTTSTNDVSDREVIHTDDFMDMDWSALSSHVATKCNHMQRFLVEGVRVPHCLRKGMQVDCVVWMGTPHVLLSDGQKTMTKACETIFREWRHENPETFVLYR